MSMTLASRPHMSESKKALVLVAGAAFVIGILFQRLLFPQSESLRVQTIEVVSEVTTPCPETVEPNRKHRTFYEVASDTTTDKINHHTYELLYEKYLSEFLDKGSIKILEIGLGCNMAKGPGASLKLWVEYFKGIKMELHFMEYNGACAKKWEPLYPQMTMHIGDQSKISDLQSIIDRAGGDFDVIIDDGGHTMKQQITSMEYLIPNALKPGGYYFMEDSITSSEGGGYLDMDKTTPQFIHSLMDDMDKSWYYSSTRMPRSGTLHQYIYRIDFQRSMYVLTKMPKEEDRTPSMKGRGVGKP